MYKRILTVQDISCVGQCSMTVALPILSACGLETCILPSALLSTHTGGFTGFTVHGLSDEFPKIAEHWEKEKIKFEAVYTGYLGNRDHIENVLRIYNSCAENGVLIVDPAMADNGKLYYGFDAAYVDAMRSLCEKADIILPNITEACLLTDTPYPDAVTDKFAEKLTKMLADRFDATVILTGVPCDKKLGVFMYENGKISRYLHKKIAQSYHGTGDIYSAAFTGAYLQGKSIADAVKLAADYTVRCIEATVGDDAHWYGVKFEKELPYLIEKLCL